MKAAPKPLPPRTERLIAASIASYVLQLAKSSEPPSGELRTGFRSPAGFALRLPGIASVAEVYLVSTTAVPAPAAAPPLLPFAER